jgi:diketogulonate reductase-like aldo/keto reductase
MTTPAQASDWPAFLYGTAWKEDDTQRCVETAIEAGFRGIDTANQRRHYVEAAVGEALARLYERKVVARDDLFLQTKFTSRQGQDHRLPYDPSAPLAAQVEQSFRSSLEHLGTEVLDAYVLHGPLHPVRWTDEDDEIWRAMEALHRAGKARHLGVSNVRIEQLRALCERASVAPRFVQNRCFARMRWDAEVRAFCREHGIVYQGFSLLTANGEIAKSPRFGEIVRRSGLTPAQVVFCFARAVGMLPLTGTTKREHMLEDLACLELELPEADVEALEDIAFRSSP